MCSVQGRNGFLYLLQLGPGRRMRVANLLRQLLDLEKTWAIMPATLGRKLAEKENCRIVSIENGPEYRTCYAIMNDQRSEHPLIDDFLNELLKTVGNIPEIRLLDLTFRRKNP